MENVHGIVDESRHASWAGFPNELSNVFTRTQDSRTSRLCSTSLNILFKNILKKFCKCENLGYSSPSWTRSTLFNDKAIKWAKAKACVCADSVLSVGRTGQIEDLKRYSSYQDAVGLDGEAIEFERKTFHGFTTLTTLQEIQKDLEKKNFEPENFKDQISFMSMFNDNEWKENDENCIFNAEKVKNYAKRFLPGHWTFLGPGSEEMVWRLSRSTRTVGPHSQQNGTAILKKLVILSSQAPVLWVVGSWSRKEVKVPFTSKEILWTRNSCFKEFIPWIRSVSLRPSRMLSVRFDKWRKRTSRYSFGQ